MEDIPDGLVDSVGRRYHEKEDTARRLIGMDYVEARRNLDFADQNDTH